MLRATVIVCAAALALAACSTGESEPGQYPGEDWKAESSVLEKLTEKQMCDLVSDETIEKAFGTTVNGGKGTKRGKMPVLLVYGCSYETEGLPTISTDLSTTRPSKSDQEVLDGVFTDLTKENAPPSEYDKVAGLGTRAGFGRDAMVGNDLNAWDLGALATVNDERILLTVSVIGESKQAPMQAMAEELLTNLEPALR